MGFWGGILGVIGGFFVGGPIGAALGGVAGSAAGEILDDIFSDPPSNHIEAKKISILGMKESGKTQFLKTLQREPYQKYLQTGTDDYEKFPLLLTSGKVVEIASGKDIGGSDSFVLQYKKISKDADAVFFIFDVYRFKSDVEYRKQTRARLQYIDDELGIPESKRAVIGSHADQFVDDAKKREGQHFAIENLQDIYKPIFTNFFMRDMRKYNQVIEICDKLLL